MTTDDEIENNKLRAVKGWLTDAPPPPVERTPSSHIGKWRKMILGKKNI